MLTTNEEVSEMKENNKVVSAKSKNTKVKAAISKTAREIPIIAWAVEIDGIVSPANVLSTRQRARWYRNTVEHFDDVKRAHVRKIAIQVIPGR